MKLKGYNRASKIFYTTSIYNVQIRGMCRLVKPPIKKGPQGGRYQPEPKTEQKKRYLLDKKVQTGPQGGKFQTYKDKHGHVKHRHLLHKK